MLRVAVRRVGLFDAAEVCGRAVPGDSFYALLAEHGDRIVRGEDFAGCYWEGAGRPSIPPSLLAKLLLLQFREGVSDERAMECVRLHLGWKVALGLAIDHRGFHPTTLVRFRARLLLHGQERLALERTLELATELGLLRGRVEQIVDSTPMLGAAATRDTVRLVRCGVWKLIGAVAGEDPRAAAELEHGLEFDYREPNAKPDCDWRSRPRREAMLTRIAEDAERALRAVEAAPELLRAEAVSEAQALLRELLGQDFDVDDEGVPRLHRGTRSGRIVSVHDPEMRHGRKSESQRFDGYKLHAAATNTERPLICAVEVEPASDRDGPQAKALVDRQPAERRPTRLLGDTAYGDTLTREDMEERDVELLAPVPTPNAGKVFGKERFTVDLEGGTVRCPAGHVQPVPATVDRRGQRGVRFPRTVCGPCPLHSRCTTSERRKLTLARREDLLLAARLALENPRQLGAPPPHATPHRTPAGPARAPLRSPQEPLPRQAKSDPPSRVRRRPRQPQPDRHRPARADGLMTAAHVRQPPNH